jgi:hypothetical protein
MPACVSLINIVKPDHSAPSNVEGADLYRGLAIQRAAVPWLQTGKNEIEGRPKDVGLQVRMISVAARGGLGCPRCRAAARRSC